MEIKNKYAFFIRGLSWNRNNNKSLSGGSKSRGRSKSPGKFVKVCWKSKKEGHYKKYCRSKIAEKGKGSKDACYAEAKTSSDGGDLYLAS